MNDKNGKKIIVGDVVGFWGWDFYRQKNDLFVGRVKAIGSENVEVETTSGEKVYKRGDQVEVDASLLE